MTHLSKNKTLPRLHLTCAHCANPFPYTGGRRKKYCSPACKQAAYRKRLEVNKEETL